MATKPAGNPDIWAQTVNYPAGADPWSGNATKVTAPTATGVGFTPDTGIVAEYANDELNTLSTWVRWLSFGAFALQEDAHVVETDSTGATNLVRLSMAALTPSTAGPLLFIDGTNVIGPQLVSVSSNGGPATAIACDTSSADGALRATNGGSGPGVRATNSGTGPAITGDVVAGDGAGAELTGFGAGAGVVATPGATGSGVVATCEGAGTFGVDGVSSPSNPNSFGVRGQAAQAAAGGVLGLQTVAGASLSSVLQAAVAGIATDSTAVFGQSTNGYGVWAQSDTTNPARAALHIEPQDAKPTTIVAGDLWFRSDRSRLYGFQSGTATGVVIHGSEYGWAGGTSNTGSGTFNSAGTTIMCTNSLGIDQMPVQSGRIVVVTLTVNLRNADASSHHVTIAINDTTAASTILERTVYLDTPNATIEDGGTHPDAYERFVTLRLNYPVPAAGARVFEATIAVDPTGGAGVDYDQAILTIDGVF